MSSQEKLRSWSSEIALQQDLFSVMTTSAPRETVSSVGRSFRTYAKLALLNKYLGMQTGVASVRYPDHRFVLHDLTSGDGAPVPGLSWERGCSPGLVAYHAEHAAKSDLQSTVFLSERATQTFKALRSNLARELRFREWTVDLEPQTSDSFIARYDVEGSGSATLMAACSDRPLVPTVAEEGELGFYFFDPNSIADWPLFPRDFLASAKSRLTLSLSTLGCNASGVKRLAKGAEERLEWKRSALAVAHSIHAWHDAFLIALEGDSHQWAYLATAPMRWREDIEKATLGAFRGHKIQTAWLKKSSDDRLRFYGLCDVLFSTRKELEGK